MYHIKNDQRSIRSSEMLYDGLAKLMRERAFSSITVKDLVEAAQVGRTTFYRNFDKIEDILRLRCDQTFDGLRNYFMEYYQKNPNAPRIRQLKPLLRYFYLHSDIIELLVLAKRMDIIHDAFYRIHAPFKANAVALHNLETEDVDYVIMIRIGIVTNILIHWIETGKKQAPDELADRLHDMMSKMMSMNQLL